jgi:hypothetical protein
MKIPVFVVIDESYSYGDLNNVDKKYFISEELRDDYFENVLRKKYKEDEELEEISENQFDQKGENIRWSYNIGKGKSSLEIIESKTW